MNVDWEPFGEIVRRNERFVLTSHVRPDADALGSELAMAEYLDRLGKTVDIVNPSEIPHTLRFLDPDGRAVKVGDDVTGDRVMSADVHVVLDTSAWKQLGEVAPLLRQSPATKVVIDHHVSSDDLGAVEFKDVTAEATGSLLFRMAESFGWSPTPSIARNLFCAIATDTGWFRFPSTSSETYRQIATLIDAGAVPHELYRELYEKGSLARLSLAGRVLSRVETACDGRLVYATATRADFEATGALPVDTENLVNECLKVETAECAFLAVEQHNGQVKFSLRSRGETSVAEVAERFGGGGHDKAAGVTVAGPVRDAVAHVRAAITEAFAVPTLET